MSRFAAADEFHTPSRKTLDVAKIKSGPNCSTGRQKRGARHMASGKTSTVAAFSKTGRAQFDVSIILNLHNEARYFRRTILSLEEAVRYARQFDISFEIVVVLDNPDTATTEIAENHNYTAFDAHQILRVKNGAPGLSRNDGISAACGDFIVTMDADDLVGLDFFQRCYMTARSGTPKTIVFPEYYVGFGLDYYVWKFHAHKFLGNAVFFDTHPYVARIMFRRDLFREVRNADASLKNGYAHEDWHFNCECIAAGCDVQVAVGAVVFYRERSRSMRRLFSSETSGLIPPSRFFDPSTYLKLTWSDFGQGTPEKIIPNTFKIEEFLSRPGIAEIVAAANRIDPAISLGILKYRSVGSNYVAAGPLARIYFEACLQLAGERFTDVLLVPFMAKGGAEKYIIAALEALRRRDPDFRLLVLGGHQFDKHEWVERLPEGSLFIDLWSLSGIGLTMRDLAMATLRLIQHVPGVRRVHMKNCEFVDVFMRQFGRFLGDFDTTLYYFCDPRVTVDGVTFVNGQCFDLVAETGRHLTRVVSDHAANLIELDRLVGSSYLPQTETLYTICDLSAAAPDANRKPQRKLLWASRLDEQKRPHLVPLIAKRLAAAGVKVTIDAYGGTTYGLIGEDVFGQLSSLAYRGNYDGFAAIPAEHYDAFLYTAAFDGLPNVVLEAMAAGLPVIAPDVGGIGEAVSDRTGYLVVDDADEDAVVERFVAAIKAMYQAWPEAVQRGQNGRQLIAERHSAEAFQARVDEVFSLEKNSRPAPAELLTSR